MKVKNFLETYDNFTKDELNIVLRLLEILQDSLFDLADDIVKSMDDCNLEDLKTINDEFQECIKVRRVFSKFYFTLNRFVMEKDWGEY